MQLPDPSLQEDYCQTFGNEIKITIQNQQLKIDDQVMVRLFKKNTQQAYKIQLTSQTNVSFFYKCIITKTLYDDYLKNQSSNQNRSFTSWFKGFFFQGQNLKYILQLINQNEAQLIIYQQSKYKSYQIIRFTFQLIENKDLKMNVMYRYQKMKVRKEYLKWYWNQMVNVVKTKNPSLLLHLDSKTKKTAFK